MRKFFVGLIAAIMIAGCATPADYQAGVNTAVVTNTSVLKLISIGANARLISQADGFNLIKQTEVAQAGIDLANTLPVGTEQTDKLKQSRAILSGIIEYLAKKGVK